MLLLLCQLFFLEISAEDAAETLYRMKGQPACLHPEGQPPFQSAKWTRETIIIFSNNNMNPVFKKEMLYYKSSSTLCIKNLTMKDDGNYIFFHEFNFTNFHKTYRLIVQDAVPKPALSVTVEQANASQDICILTVNCSVQYHHELLWLQSECDKHACRFVNKSFSQINITISNGNGRLTCASNNHVSSKEDSRNIDKYCFNPEPQETIISSVSKDLIRIVLICSVAVGGLFIFCVGAIVLTSLTRRKKQLRVIQSQPFEQPSQPRTSISSTQADSYENIDSENPNENSDHESENAKVRSVYCVLEPRPTSALPTDQPVEPHTVYSVITMP